MDQKERDRLVFLLGYRSKEKEAYERWADVMTGAWVVLVLYGLISVILKMIGIEPDREDSLVYDIFNGIAGLIAFLIMSAIVCFVASRCAIASATDAKYQIKALRDKTGIPQ